MDESIVVPWTLEIERDLVWWFDTDHLLQGVSLEVQCPDLLFWSDDSDHGWGANLQDQFVLGRWLVKERSLHKSPRISGHTSWATSFPPLSEETDLGGVYRQHHGSFMSRNGGTYSLAFNRKAQILLQWAESLDLTLDSSIYHRVSECGGRLPEPSSAGPQFGMDLGSGGCG